MKTTKTEGRYVELRRKYPYIAAWCRMMGSYPYWVHEQLDMAEQLNAPANTTSIDQRTKKISTLDDVKSTETLTYLEQLKP